LIQTYWDTSALLKLYVPESDSTFFVDLIAKDDQPVYTSVITAIEIRCALNRKEQAGDIRRVDAIRAMKKFTADCGEGRITRLPCNDETASLAQDIVDFASAGRKPVMLRSLDAIHLASAQTIRAASVVTTDLRMRDIAAMLRLKLIPGK
jgi:predicted nucleic acid-binding protein